MPRPPSQRFGSSDEDTVPSFERAAAQRHKDADSLRRAGRSLGAIYLYGYSVEMRIKAAYFRTVFQASGLDPATRIDVQRRRDAARNRARVLLGRSIGPHEIGAWAELLVIERETLTTPYPLHLANDIVNRSAVVHLNWREYMRYRSNRIRSAELAAVRAEADWFRLHYPAI